ncbi:hypothetical protein ACIPV2_08585 [Microbacterium sp. NPDC089987]|uniref:DsrE family protein n=1 Tax=Microbacterium sp. NPDC089987 TaxID=3364202 RepID=UPI0037F9D851
MTASRTVVIHVTTDPADVARSINSARILHKDRPEHRIRIIVNGPAITGVTRSADALAIDKLPEGAAIEACEGGMRAHEIAVEDLQDGIRTVPAAIVALTDAQFEGAAYIRL